MATLHQTPTVRHISESLEDNGALLWRAGSFACELHASPDADCPAFLCVLKDSEPVLEVPVLSALQAEERANSLQAIVERHLG